MMKRIRVLKDGREIESLVLHRPFHLIGRSPNCDLVLRAKGIRPIHYVVEWLGEGSFKAQGGSWSMFEVVPEAAESGQSGVILDAGATRLGDFEFCVEETTIDINPEIGGGYQRELSEHGRGPRGRVGAEDGVQCLEFVQLHRASGSLEQVSHFDYPGARYKKPLTLSEDVPEFKVRWEIAANNKTRITFDESTFDKDFKVYQGAQEEVAIRQAVISSFEILKVSYRTNTFFLRLIPRAAEVPVPRILFDDAQSKKIFYYTFFPLFLVVGFLYFFKPIPQHLEVSTEPARVVRIQEVVMAPPPPADPTPPPLAYTSPQVAPSPSTPAPLGAGQAGSSRRKPDLKRSTVALGEPAPRKNVTQMGVLGILGKGAKGRGVSPDQVTSLSGIGDMPSSKNASIVLNSGVNGALGSGDRSNPNGAANDKGLTGAATQLTGGAYDPKSTNPLVGGAGAGGGALGSIGGGSGSGIGSGGMGTSGFNAAGLKGLNISGGLDRETVRRIVRSRQGQFQTCYEKALLASPRISGRFVFDWSIGANGDVTQVKQVKTETPSEPDFVACLELVIKEMVFPKASNGKPTRVIYPFEFKSNAPS